MGIGFKKDKEYWVGKINMLVKDMIKLENSKDMSGTYKELTLKYLKNKYFQWSGYVLYLESKEFIDKFKEAKRGVDKEKLQFITDMQKDLEKFL